MGFLQGALGALGGGAVTGAYTGNKKVRGGVNNFLFGTPERTESSLMKEQMPLYQQLLASSQGQGAGGAFGNAADYYYGNLSNNPQDFQAFAAPEMRQFREQIVPDLAEQFAGMGSGGLSSSGFRNAAVNAGTDLSERLGAIRAQLRSQAAQGLTGLGQLGLQDRKVIRPGTPGFLQSAAPGIGQAATSYLSGGMPSGFGSTSPYGMR